VSVEEGGGSRAETLTRLGWMPCRTRAPLPLRTAGSGVASTGLESPSHTPHQPVSLGILLVLVSVSVLEPGVSNRRGTSPGRWRHGNGTDAEMDDWALTGNTWRMAQRAIAGPFYQHAWRGYRLAGRRKEAPEKCPQTRVSGRKLPCIPAKRRGWGRSWSRRSCGGGLVMSMSADARSHHRPSFLVSCTPP
jgi:hypothetical protein